MAKTLPLSEARGVPDDRSTAVNDHGHTQLSPVVVRLGWVSFFTDAASEMLYPLIPIFLTVTLGAPVVALGLVEGLADGVASGLKAVAGVIADRYRNHKRLIAAGYGLSAVSKPLLALAPNWGVVAALRVSDRVGKGVRGVPRDVMIDEVTPTEQRGRAFGFHRAMDTAGAVVGPLIALAALTLIGKDRLRPVFIIAIVPGLASLLLLRSLPNSTRPVDQPDRARVPLPWRGRFGWLVVVLIVFGLGNSSDAFLLLRAHNLGLSASQVILAYALYNFVYAAVSLPAGIRADRIGRGRVFGAGLVVFALVYTGFGLIHHGSRELVWPLMAVYGVYMALTDGVGRALALDFVPGEARGRALGVTQAVTGASVLVAGISAGLLWDHVSPSTPFLVGGALGGSAAVLLAASMRAGRGRAVRPAA
jgi:MFS family permease